MHAAWAAGSLAGYRPTVADLAMCGTDRTADEVGKLSEAVTAFCAAVTARARR